MYKGSTKFDIGELFEEDLNIKALGTPVLTKAGENGDVRVI